MKKIWTAVLLMLLLGILLCACSGTDAGTGAEPDGFAIDASSLMNYVIVRSDYAEGDLVQCGMDVRSALENAGYSLKLTTDFYREGRTEFAMRDYEILVGETNRPETQEFLDGLQMWQYGYALVGQKLVIAGHDDAATRLAVDEFLRFVAGRPTFTFSAADNYIYGEVKEGEGKVYSLLTYNFGAGSVDDAKLSAVAAEVEAYAPDFLIVQNAYGDTAEKLGEQLSGYGLGADEKADTKHSLMYYRTETYTYSSAGRLSMSQMPTLSDAERGSFAYCVVRCAETKDKYVFCAADLSGVAEESVRNRMKVFGSFAENCSTLPIFFAGIYDGAVGTPACQSLTEYGFADVTRLSAENEGTCAENYLYAAYDKIAAAKSVVTEHGIYTEFQRAK
ncbi:MAG: hypothetical protein ACI4V1_05830 [Eubacteriales bacterium]